MRYAIVTAFLAFGLAGCNLNGINFDVTGLPSLEVNGNCRNNSPQDGGGNCRLVWKNADDQDDPDIDQQDNTPSLPEPQISSVRIETGSVTSGDVGPTGDELINGSSVKTVGHIRDFTPYPYTRVNDENNQDVPDVRLLYSANEANDMFRLKVVGPSILWRNLPAGDIHYSGSDVFIREPDGTSGIKGTLVGKANFDDMLANVKLEASNLKIDARNMTIDGRSFIFSNFQSGDVDLTRDGWEYETRNGWDTEGNPWDWLKQNKIDINGQFHGAGEAMSGSFRVFDGTVGIFTADKVEPETDPAGS